MRQTVLLLAALLLPASAGAQDWRGPAALAVQVEDAKGKNLTGAEVLLVYLSPDGGGTLPPVLTGGDGQANIGGLAAGRWSAEIRHAGHMSYRAELLLSAEGRPVVQSASHLMAPGATSTMKVKFSRGRGAAAAPIAPAQVPAAVAPVPTVAKEKAPVEEVTAVEPVAPAPAPVVASTVAKAPEREPPVPTVTPAPAPVPAVAAEKAPVKVVPSVPPSAPAAAPAPAPASANAPAMSVPAPAPVPGQTVPTQPSPATPAPLSPATPAVVAPVRPAVAPAPAPAAAPAPLAPVVAAPAVAPPSSPASAAPARARLCVECAAGESAAWGEAALPGGAAAGCPADLPARLKTVELDAVAQLSADLAAAGTGCRVIAVELPAGARFTGYRYEAQSAGVAADCLPGRGCPAGDCRFPADPVLRQVDDKTVLLVPFESTAADARRAVVAGYSTYQKR